MVESPENASAIGDTRFNDRWSDVSLAAIAKREGEDRAALARLRAIGRDGLSPADQLNYDTFQWQHADPFLEPGYITFSFDADHKVNGFKVDLYSPDFHFWKLDFRKKEQP